MDVGQGRWDAVGSVHRVPVDEVTGSLCLCGLEVIGPDPDALVDHLGADLVVCLQTAAEIRRRYPTYLDWLAAPPAGIEVRHLATEDHLVAPDDAVIELAAAVHRALSQKRTVVVHCGAGWGRAGTLAAVVMVAAGADVERALADLRAARPAAGPQSPEQHAQIRRLAARARRVVAPGG